MKKEKQITIELNPGKYLFEDEELIYDTDKIIYKYEELFPKSEGYENPFKIKKLKLISIEKMECPIDITVNLDVQTYRLWFIDKKGKIYNPLAGEGIFIYCSAKELSGMKYNVGYLIKKTYFASLNEE